MLRFLVAVVVLGALLWAGHRFIPAQTQRTYLARIGLDRVIETMIPDYLRKTFVLSKNPTAERMQLIDRIAATNEKAKASLAKISDASVDPVTEQTLGEVRDLMEDTQRSVGELKTVNDQDSTFHTTAARVVDAVLPAPNVCEMPKP